MKTQLSKSQIKNKIQNKDISTLKLNQIEELFNNEVELKKFSPDGVYQIDPRTQDRIVYNSARSKRPHDNRPNDQENIDIKGKSCVICEGNTTNIVDIADLSEGFTFINKNLFPVFFPKNSSNSNKDQNLAVYGYHFLQWTSSIHQADWQNMPLEDRIIVMQRLAALEKKIVENKNNHILIIKNYGYLVGGSLVHGHQQIGVNNLMPNKIKQDIQFEKENQQSFSEYMQKKTPQQLIIKEYEHAILITPYFMRRPFDMQLILKDTSVSFIHQLNQNQLTSVVEGWHDAINIMLKIMPKIGREKAYNITTHNGFGNSLYFEFLPYTQEMGGFEHLGIFSCQGNPYQSASDARNLLLNEGETI